MNIIQKILKIKFLFLICLVLLTLFFPWSASAGFWSGFVNVVIYIPTILIAVFIAVAILISSLFFQLIGAILDWVISPGFVSLSYTRPCNSFGLPAGCNPIIGMGLDITQSFVNLALVVILVVIALSIALRLGEYGSKKIFAKLIIIALLVNFAPVLVGLIVDAANILMNFFLTGIGESAIGIWTQISTFGESAIKTLFSFRGESLVDKGGLLMQGITQVIVNLGMAFAFLLYAFLFLMRYVVIWTLVILSPLAFVAWILPATKKLWDMWWNQLIQWSIIGIPIAFFLYLAMNSFAVLQQTFVSNLNMPGGVEAGWFDKVFPFFIIIVFLILGFTIGLQTGAMGASGVISLAKKGARSAGAWTRKKAWEKGKAWGREAGERVTSSERAQQFAQRMATYTPRGRFAQVAGAPIWALGRAMGRAAGPGLIETERKAIDETEKKVAGQRVEAQMATWASARTNAERIGILNAITKDKHIEDAMDVTRFGNAAIPQARIERLYDIAQARDKHTVLRAAFPEIARTHLPAGTPPTPPPPGITQAQHQAQYVFDRIRPADYENMSRQVIGDPTRGVPGDNEFSEAMIRRGTDRHIHRFIDRFQMEGAIAFEQRLHALGAAAGMTPRQFLQNVNPRLYRYFTRGAGQGLIHI